MSEHAFLAPSAAALTVQCAASPKLRARYPQMETDAMREGTAAHEVVQRVLAGKTPAIGAAMSNGVLVTQEMIGGADLVAEWMASCGRRLNWHIEETLRDSPLHPMNWGTPDYWAWDASKRILHIGDYKFGHSSVYAYENWQCINYAALILNSLGIKDRTGVTVRITVIRPRAYNAGEPINTWETSVQALLPYWDRLRAKYEEAAGHVPDATPGPWCNNLHCEARKSCTALQRSAFFAAEEANTGVTYDLSPEELGAELRILTEAKEVLDARIDGLREQALALGQSGTNVPYWTISYTKPPRHWAKPAAEVLALGEVLGFKLQRDPEPITVWQARKLGMSDELLAAFTEQPPGSPVLKPESSLNAVQRLKGAK